MSRLEVGDRVPEMVLEDQHRRSVDLRRLTEDRAVLVVFYPFAFSGICSGELTGLRDRLGELETDDCTLLTVSCDPVYTLRAAADRDGLFFPLLSDFWPHGEVARRFGVFDESRGCADRSSFLVGRDGLVRWAVHNPVGKARDLDAHAAAVRELDGTGEPRPRVLD
ncbi:redoxin domain-containing protein [Marmoricola endophyticus]|uniref:redoxin domain-containing protein n=1 Tax=Marmoricola endophyticus TaxID=2040280 RepID=UPI001E313A70|nr:redoxin domain-containing protein [Marmoricola endophyticus]